MISIMVRVNYHAFIVSLTNMCGEIISTVAREWRIEPECRQPLQWRFCDYQWL